MVIFYDVPRRAVFRVRIKDQTIKPIRILDTMMNWKKLDSHTMKYPILHWRVIVLSTIVLTGNVYHI